MDDLGMPYHHAPAGKSDIELIYNNHALLVEATLLIDKAGQSNSETSAIVKRGSDFQSKTKLITCSMLVAPRIHFETIMFFKTLFHNAFSSLNCSAFPISIEKFVENFINLEEKIGVLVEKKFSEFKDAKVDEKLSKIVN
ncbi:hypothetical protein C1645_819532 [Glomus cerebriforme]|uniref:Uncharacterized protein n=1 Tax=Glomus cerebriforme TaxID=658196 RepID=A0A397TEF2_9GLOM|nr:hypothetical protein C1645_819532 [Glomus cerebriforme]